MRVLLSLKEEGENQFLPPTTQLPISRQRRHVAHFSRKGFGSGITSPASGVISGTGSGVVPLGRKHLLASKEIRLNSSLRALSPPLVERLALLKHLLHSDAEVPIGKSVLQSRETCGFTVVRRLNIWHAQPMFERSRSIRHFPVRKKVSGTTTVGVILQLFPVANRIPIMSVAMEKNFMILDMGWW